MVNVTAVGEARRALVGKSPHVYNVCDVPIGVFLNNDFELPHHFSSLNFLAMAPNGIGTNEA
ncbi:hypothetical protein M1O19_02145 [Dehalococcoidia bacterium]|nr:hypothetical protein [Dehalococcoidia bacterium]